VTAAGDREGFAALSDRHRQELQVYCYRMLGSFHEAEDLVQETFERAWRAIDRVEASASLRAWLYRIATNACLDALRQRRRRRVLPFEVMDPVRPDRPLPAAADELWLEPFPDRPLGDLGGEAGPDPGETVVHRETIELVFLAAIQHLPARQRVVFIARDVMGWSAKATAALLGTSEVSVKSALQQARAIMKEQLPQRRADWGAAVEVGERERQVLRRYIDAHQQDDIEALAAVLSEDVRVAYPQIPLWSDSREAFIQATREFAPQGTIGWWPPAPTCSRRWPSTTGRRGSRDSGWWRWRWYASRAARSPRLSISMSRTCIRCSVWPRPSPERLAAAPATRGPIPLRALGRGNSDGRTRRPQARRNRR
jgi:RNA polymerase sigma-70 factor, ECF subfamily